MLEDGELADIDMDEDTSFMVIHTGETTQMVPVSTGHSRELKGKQTIGPSKQFWR